MKPSLSLHMLDFSILFPDSQFQSCILCFELGQHLYKKHSLFKGDYLRCHTFLRNCINLGAMCFSKFNSSNRTKSGPLLLYFLCRFFYFLDLTWNTIYPQLQQTSYWAQGTCRLTAIIEGYLENLLKIFLFLLFAVVIIWEFSFLRLHGLNCFLKDA